MTFAAFGRWFGGVALVSLLGIPLARAAEKDAGSLAKRAQAILEANCHRCHGQDGAIEGGMNFILNRDKLVATRKIVPGSADTSPLYKRVANGKMPPAGETPRPSAVELAVLKQWIAAGAPGVTATVERPFLAETDLYNLILADLETVDKRSRRFIRYFSLAHLYNAGLSDDELQTYRHALSKLINSLSWHPRITVPRPIDPARAVLRIDLRDFMWDANLWNRLLAEYPYGIFHDTATAKAVIVATMTRMPLVRADWFVATASRPPLYQDLLQLPASLAELERQLRVDSAVNIQQERVARAGFNGSGVSKNNRLIERHDAVHGAYWRTYDFEAVAQNLVERDNLLPDRRNLFAHPLGPGFTESSFQHFGGEAIFNLPNGLQAYLLVNANGVRVDKAPTAIVSDPKRPDRAVETGISCMSCHVTGILPKSDQIREFVEKNRKAFKRADVEIIEALYVPEARMKSLMEEDAERFRHAVEKTGARISQTEPVTTMTLRYEGDVDLPTAAAEAGLRPAEFVARLGRSELLARNLGALRTSGGTVHRQVLLQSFADLVREIRLGTPFQPAAVGQVLPDNTGEVDPLEGQSSVANSMAFSPDRRFALFASADKSVRLWEMDRGLDLRRFIGHTASVWSVAFSPDGRKALSGGMDNTVRLWDVATGQELRRLEGHTALVTAVAFSPDGRRALSAGYDHAVCLWDLETGREIQRFEGRAKYINALAFTPDGRRVLVAAEKTLRLWELESGKELLHLDGHTDSVLCVVCSADGRQALSGSDDRTLRLWDLAAGREVRAFPGHVLSVKSVAFSPDGRAALSGSADHTVRLWDLQTGKELLQFNKHTEPVISVAFSADGRETLSGSRDSRIFAWVVKQAPAPAAPKEEPSVGRSGQTQKSVKPAVTVKMVARGQSGKEALIVLSLLPNGVLATAEGSELHDDAKLRQTLSRNAFPKELGRQYVELYLTDEKATSVGTLAKAVARLTAACDAAKETTIFVNLEDVNPSEK